MGVTSSIPDVPGAPSAEREAAMPSSAPPKGGSAVAGPWEAGTGEDWTSMATGDPAFWLKQ